MIDLLDVAADNEMKIAFHLKTYKVHTAYTIKSDIQYILANYGNPPAVLKIVRSNKWGNTSLDSPIFYVVASVFI